MAALSTLFGKKTAPTGPQEAAAPVPASEPANQEETRLKPASGITLSEKAAAEKLWIREEDLVALRKGMLKAGIDYVRTAGFVRITESGLRELGDLIAEGNNLVVQSIAPMNPHIVVARIPGKEDLQRVRVADNGEWAKGMVMSGCVQDAAKEAYWTCTVRPRFRGRA